MNSEPPSTLMARIAKGILAASASSIAAADLAVA